jgi:WD40 repeat protein
MRVRSLQPSFLMLLTGFLPACAPSRPAAPEAQATPPAVTVQPSPKTDLYGDPLPPGAIARMGKTSSYPDDGVDKVCFFPDGKKLVSIETANKQQIINLWETNTGNHIREIDRGPCLSFALSLDGKALASSSGRVICVWDTITWSEVFRLQSGDVVGALAYSPNGKTLVSCNWAEPKSISLWDMATREILFNIDKADSPAAFSPNGHVLAVIDKHLIQLWAATTGKKILRINVGKDSVCSMDFSPDGKTLATGCRDKTICFWEIASGKNNLTLKGHQDTVSSTAFSPDGMMLASGSWDKTIRLWETATGKERRCIPVGSMDMMSNGRGGEVLSVAFSPDGTRLASGMSRKTILIWDVAALLKDRK